MKLNLGSILLLLMFATYVMAEPPQLNEEEWELVADGLLGTGSRNPKDYPPETPLGEAIQAGDREKTLSALGDVRQGKNLDKLLEQSLYNNLLMVKVLGVDTLADLAKQAGPARSADILTLYRTEECQQICAKLPPDYLLDCLLEEDQDDRELLYDVISDDTKAKLSEAALAVDASSISKEDLPRRAKHLLMVMPQVIRTIQPEQFANAADILSRFVRESGSEQAEAEVEGLLNLYDTFTSSVGMRGAAISTKIDIVRLELPSAAALDPKKKAQRKFDACYRLGQAYYFDASDYEPAARQLALAAKVFQENPDAFKTEERQQEFSDLIIQLGDAIDQGLAELQKEAEGRKAKDDVAGAATVAKRQVALFEMAPLVYEELGFGDPAAVEEKRVALMELMIAIDQDEAAIALGGQGGEAIMGIFKNHDEWELTAEEATRLGRQMGIILIRRGDCYARKQEQAKRDEQYMAAYRFVEKLASDDSAARKQVWGEISRQIAESYVEVEPDSKNGARAVKLAERAVALADAEQRSACQATLAKAYYLAGNPAKSLETIELALKSGSNQAVKQEMESLKGKIADEN